MLYLLFNRLGYEIKWLTQSETEIAVISSLLGIAVIFCLWSSITSSLAKLRWRDILYIPSLLVIQLVIHFAIIAICLLTVKGFSLSDPAVSGNQQSLDAMGNEYRNQIVSVIAIFIWSALVGPFVENVFFMYFIQGRLLESITVRLSNTTGVIIRVILTPLLFMAWHLTSWHDLTNPFFYQYVSLAWLAIIYERTHSLAKIWVAHAGLNGVGMALILS